MEITTIILLLPTVFALAGIVAMVARRVAAKTKNKLDDAVTREIEETIKQARGLLPE